MNEWIKESEEGGGGDTVNDQWAEETHRHESEDNEWERNDLTDHSPGWLGWAGVCPPSQPGRLGAVVSMPTTGWAGLQCNTYPQLPPGCSCRRNWEATTPTDSRGKQRKATVRRAGRNKAQNKSYTFVILPRYSFNYSIHNKAAVVRLHTVRGTVCPSLITPLLLLTWSKLSQCGGEFSSPRALVSASILW